MDLLAQLQKSVKNPFKIGNFFVIFVTLFIFLIIGLVLLAGIRYFVKGSRDRSACDRSQEKSVVDSVKQNNDVIYKISNSGNQHCFMTVWITWEQPNDLSLWIYDPDGNITTLENSQNTRHIFFYQHPPVQQGDWRLVVKNSTEETINYKGEISFR